MNVAELQHFALKEAYICLEADWRPHPQFQLLLPCLCINNDSAFNQVGSRAGDAVCERGERVNTVLFSSQTVEWATPRALYQALDAEFHFNFDPCPQNGEVDGTARLLNSWHGKRVFCNPPYGPEIRDFLECWSDADLAVYLLPARTDTRWFHDVCIPFAREIRFIRGRLKFGKAEKSAPFPSMVVIFERAA